MIFPDNQNNDNYIVTSAVIYPDYDKFSIKLFSFNTWNFIRNINNGNLNTYYLLEWHNKKNDNYYIIQFVYDNILITSLLQDELYAQLGKNQGNFFLMGFYIIKIIKKNIYALYLIQEI